MTSIPVIDSQAHVSAVMADPAQPNQPNQPTTGASRIADLDVIRGVALFGVLTMNLVNSFRLPRAYVAGVRHADVASSDPIAESVLTVLLADKAMTLFSILFGVGLAIFYERARARGPGAMRLLARRLLVLLGVGLLHSIFIWDGDILTPYALSGLIVLSLLRAPSAVLLSVAAAMLAVHPLVSWLRPMWLPQPGPAAEHYRKTLDTLGHGSYLQIVAHRIETLVHFRFRTMPISALPREMTNMLLGIVLWRSGVLRHVERHRRVLRWVCALGIAIGAGYAIHRQVSIFGMASVPTSTPFRRVLWNATVAAFGLGYGAGLLLLLHPAHPPRRAGVRAFLLRFAPLGRMAFTNYLTESLVFSTLFYSYGLGMLGKVGVMAATAIGVIVYVLQAMISTHWLRQFRFGPLEWAWRSLTYGAAARFRVGRVGRMGGRAHLDDAGA